MTFCAHSTSWSREQSTKRRSRSKNMRKVCLFYSQVNENVWLSNMADTVLRNSWGAQRFVGFFFLIVLFGCWLAGQANFNHVANLAYNTETSYSKTAFDLYDEIVVRCWTCRLVKDIRSVNSRAFSSTCWPLGLSRSAQPISTRQAQSRIKSPQTFAYLVNFSNMCLPCLIIIQSCYCDYRMNKPIACSCCVISVSFAIHVISMYYVRKGLWAFMGLFILITHKSQ